MHLFLKVHHYKRIEIINRPSSLDIHVQLDVDISVGLQIGIRKICKL